MNFPKPGDQIALIQPATKATSSQLDQAKDLFESWGYQVVTIEEKTTCPVKELQFAGNDEERAEIIYNLLADPKIKAIIAIRGGYGTYRLIPHLLQKHPLTDWKPFFGFSDLTALHLFLKQKWGWKTFHADTASRLIALPEKHQNLIRFKELLAGKKPAAYKLSPINQLAKEEPSIEGEIIGGNLALIQASLATDWQIEPNNKIILLEDEKETPLRVDRMLNQLKQAGIFEQAKALLFGDFLEDGNLLNSKEMQAIRDDFAAHLKIPVHFLPNVGHGENNYPIIFGDKYKISHNQLINLG